MMLKESKKRMTPDEYAKEVKEALSEFTKAINSVSDTTFVNTAKELTSDLRMRKTSAKAKGTRRRRRNRNTKKKRKL